MGLRDVFDWTNINLSLKETVNEIKVTFSKHQSEILALQHQNQLLLTAIAAQEKVIDDMRARLGRIEGVTMSMADSHRSNTSTNLRLLGKSEL